MKKVCRNASQTSKSKQLAVANKFLNCIAVVKPNTRILLILLLLVLGWSSANSSVFYVSNAGNDAWDGTSAEYLGGSVGPWRTLNKVNQEMEMLDEQTVHFHRGDRFEGMLEIKGNNISFGAYGPGERPILSGARTLTGGWSPVEGKSNVYQIQLSADLADVTLLLCNNYSLPLGRTPNGNLLTNDAFYSFSKRTFTTLTDPELKGAENLSGSEIVLRKNVWKYFNYPVTKVEGNVVSFLNDQKQTKKKGDENLEEAGYFFQKHINTLDVEGEWYFDIDTHILYLFSLESPNQKNIQYTVSPVVVNMDQAKAVAFEGLKIEMAGSLGMKISNSANVCVRDCEIIWCGNEGLNVEHSTARIEANNISECFSAGVRSSGEGRVVITRNNLSNIGLVAGRGVGRNAIYLSGGNSEASYNRLTNIGYLGIQHLRGRNLVRRNVIDRYNLVVFDGGAIYTHGDQLGSVVEENIIINGMPNHVGLGDTIISMEVAFSTGIQCDMGTENLIVRNNTVTFPPYINSPHRGIHINFNSMDNLFQGNTILVKGAGITTLDRDPYDRPPGEPSPPSMSGNRFEENIIVCIGATNTKANYGALTCFSLKETEQCDVENQGIFLNNICAAPYNRASVINEYQLNCNPGRPAYDRGYTSAAEWNEARSYASGNIDSPIKVDESLANDNFTKLYYNDSDNRKSFSLPEGAYVDPYGNSISGSVSVDPWRSVVLFKMQ